jgi:hypothetical protein
MMLMRFYTSFLVPESDGSDRCAYGTLIDHTCERGGISLDQVAQLYSTSTVRFALPGWTL